MRKRIKEDDLEDVLNLFKNRCEKIKIQFSGFIKQNNLFKNPDILFNKNTRNIGIKDSENDIRINLGYIEEIYFEQKNKLKFLTDRELEILIIFL